MFSRFQMITLPYRFFGNEVDSIRSFDVGTQLSIEIQKKFIIPNVENKIFQRTESFLDYLRENSIFIQNGGFLSQLDKQFSKQKRLENCPEDIKHATQISCFKSTHFQEH
jgi:transcription-repair coupling factor (superfamily II helicase)